MSGSSGEAVYQCRFCDEEIADADPSEPCPSCETRGWYLATDGGEASSHMVSMAHSNYWDALDWMACVIAVENGELSENEAMRWLRMGNVERAQSQLGPRDEYRDQAADRLRSTWEEERE